MRTKDQILLGVSTTTFALAIVYGNPLTIGFAIAFYTLTIVDIAARGGDA